MHPLVTLAKSAVENYIKNKTIISPPKDLPTEFLERKAGVFVTLEKNGELRGCIGTYLPIRENIAQEVIHNAISAATKDSRFPPVQIEELPYLSYTVYILSEPELVKDISELDPKKYGIIVRNIPSPLNNKENVAKDYFIPKTGVLLPDLNGIDTIEKQILIACYKAGIDPEKETILIYKFTVERYK